MASRRDPRLEAQGVARRLGASIGQELRIARLGAGLSQRSAGAGAGMPHVHWSRIERGLVPNLSMLQACQAGAAVGLRVSLRTYPDGDPIRDAGGQALLERFRARLPAGAGWQTEVPMNIPGDRRAWDARVVIAGRRAGCEAETQLFDLQAFERRLTLKLRDGDVDILILVVADTVRNRSVLRTYREQLRPLLPLDTREILASLAAGALPVRNGIVIL
jgi:transcriptional regulator with XRE-family HTH domain